MNDLFVSNVVFLWVIGSACLPLFLWRWPALCWLISFLSGVGVVALKNQSASAESGEFLLIAIVIGSLGPGLTAKLYRNRRLKAAT